ncbi:Fe-S cluster assembly ATPase SufC [Nanobdella aerobiophila]|uniref:Fe-S cluster assembly ATPase SufC n=1 Tax=Nanobdella aerobiophila TaxID=2586965 RepID=A0A915SY12_9ARCH|nr:ATP-binding cassette domain-containing protein [Nanobdella aerobiophila]BBL45455.1 Fe-S cluster assembly ATPase SufC [Nanobdella aerobiophila]
MLKIENLSIYSEDKKILNNINLDFENGKIYLIFGPNGSGKTTLSKAILNDINYRKEGRIILNDIDITNMKTEEIAKYIYYSFQNPIEIENIKTRTILMNILKNYNEENIKKIGQELGLPDNFLDRGINHNLSGGEKKRLSLLLSILLNRDVIIFDEIDSGSDIEFMEKLKYYINKLKNEGKIIIIISHNMKFIKDINIDVVMILLNGEIKYIGSKEIINKIEEHGFSIF